MSNEIRPGVLEVEESLREKVSRYERERCKTLGDTLGFEYLVFRKDCVVVSMPVDERTWQPWGLLHGGASVALAETCASIGAWLNIDDSKSMAVGIEINANHVRATRKGRVCGTGRPVYIGATTQEIGRAHV